jgi:hypothetical protein
MSCDQSSTERSGRWLTTIRTALASLVEADHHHAADRLTPHDRCVVLDESVVSVAADIVELLVVVQLPGKAKDRAYRLRSLNDPGQHRPFDRHVVREVV